MNNFATSLPAVTSRSTKLFVGFLPTLAAWILLSLSSGRLLADDSKEQKGEAPPTLAWKLESSHERLGPGDATFYLRLRVQAGKSSGAERQPLTLALVFDRSGSMNEDAKIGYVRKAGHLVADNLTRHDHVALVAFNHTVQTLVPLHPVVNRDYLHHRIDELQAEGDTNLSGGLLEGCAQVEKRLKEPGLHHVILLTDGLANRGVTDTDGLVRLVQRYAQRGLTVTTMGVGAEYNEKLLARMAQAGGGRYVHVAKPDQIPTALDHELGALLAVVAQNVKLKMELPAGVEVQRVFGREEPLKPGVLEVPLGDLTSGEERVLVLKCRVAPGSESNGPIELPAVMTYDDVAEAQRTETKQLLVQQRAVPADAAAANQANPVFAYAQLVEAVDKIALAVEGMDLRLAAEVIDIRQKQYPAFKKTAQDSGDQDFVNKAFLFEHYVRDLQELINREALHEQSAERAKLLKDLHYRLYQMEHRRSPPR